jgi:hypothetical protein
MKQTRVGGDRRAVRLTAPIERVAAGAGIERRRTSTCFAMPAELPAIDRALGYVLRRNDQRFGIDGGLGVIGLHEAVFALHDPALRIGEVLLGLGVWHIRRRSRRP